MASTVPLLNDGSASSQLEVRVVFGREDAPYLFVITSEPSSGLMAWFWQKLAKCGVLKTDVRIIYLIDEPPKNSGNRPSVTQLRAAQPRFREEILASSPKVIVPMAGPSLHAITGLKENIYDARGYLIPPHIRGVVVVEERQEIAKYKTANKTKGIKVGDPRYGNVKRDTQGIMPLGFTGYVIPTLDPYHISSMGFAVESAFLADVIRARRAVEGKLDIVNESFPYHTSLATLSTPFVGEYLAIDIETHGVNNEVIDCVAVSDGKTTCTLPWSQPVLDWLNEIINERWHGKFAFHNGPFDIPRLRAAGIRLSEDMEINRVVDTMFGGVLPQPDLHKALGRMATLYLDLVPWKWASLKNADPVLYSATDGIVQSRLADKVFGVIRGLGMWPLFTGENFPWGPGEMATIPILTEATREGLKLNRPYVMEWTGKLEKELLEKEKRWAEMFPTVDPLSSHQVNALFYRDWKLPVVKKKNDSTTVNELAVIKSREYIKSQYAQTRDGEPWKNDPRCTPELFDLLLSIRETSKMLTTYAMPAMMNAEASVHPQYLPVSKDSENFAGVVNKGNTSTGRLASFNPNIQNVLEEGRGMYIPDSDEMCFVERDYSKAELWAMAFSANDLVALADLRSGDPYTALAKQVGTDRDTAKNVRLAGQYLAGPPKVSDMILGQQHFYVPPAKCKLILDAIAERYHATTAYKRFLVEQCRTKGYIRNPFGRVRFFPDRRGPAAVDFIPQSIVADVLWCVLRPVALFVRSLGGRLTTTVHDSILVQVPYARVAECVAGMKAIMERPFDCVAHGFYLPTEGKVGAPGASWGALEKWKEAA